MAKIKGLDASQEDVMEPQESLEQTHPEVDQLTKLAEICRELVARTDGQEKRIAELEKHAHSDHTIGQQAIDQIAAHAGTHSAQYAHKLIGHSGFPVRGDQE